MNEGGGGGEEEEEEEEEEEIRVLASSTSKQTKYSGESLSLSQNGLLKKTIACEKTR